MTELSQKDVAELRGLLAKATPGPWEYDHYKAVRGQTATIQSTINGFSHIATVFPEPGFGEPWHHDAKAIVALYNAAPALLALASQSLEREAEVRREVIEECAKVAERADWHVPVHPAIVRAIRAIK